MPRFLLSLTRAERICAERIHCFLSEPHVLMRPVLTLLCPKFAVPLFVCHQCIMFTPRPSLPLIPWRY